MSVLDDIREEFPFLAFLVNDKEIGKLLRDAVDPNKGFSPQRFEAKLINTRWWKARSETQRAWEIRRHTDPATARQDRDSYRSQLAQVAAQLGVRLTQNELRFMTEFNLGKGIAPDAPETMYALSRLRLKPGHAGAGAIRTNSRRAQMLSRSQYFMNMGTKEAAKWGDMLARGLKTDDDLNSMLADRAASRYPHLKDRLLAGESMSDMFSGHIQTIADELEIAPGLIDLTNSRWSKVIDQVDAQGQRRPLSLYETSILARQDPRFWRTQKGQAQDAQMASFMAQTFGKRA